MPCETAPGRSPSSLGRHQAQTGTLSGNSICLGTRSVPCFGPSLFACLAMAIISTVVYRRAALRVHQQIPRRDWDIGLIRTALVTPPMAAQLCDAVASVLIARNADRRQVETGTSQRSTVSNGSSTSPCSRPRPARKLGPTSHLLGLCAGAELMVPCSDYYGTISVLFWYYLGTI